MKNFLKEYFSLSNDEQRGIIVLLLGITLISIAPKLYQVFRHSTETPKNNTQLLAQFYTQKDDTTTVNLFEENKKTTATQRQLFPFNPNTTSKNELIQLGFSEKTASTLLNYRNKGGKFYKKEDLKKVYGVSEKLYTAIEPYIQIENEKASKKPSYTENKTVAIPKEDKPAISKEAVYININTADSTTLRKINGIGAVYASRIIKYRNLLGGFTNTNQLLEVYGISEEVYQNILPQIYAEGNLTTININTVNWNTLKNHPYISKEKAGIITKYVTTHGTVKNLDEILNTSIFTKEEIEKIQPYLSIK